MIYKSFSDTEIFKGETNVTYEYNIDDKDINYCIVDVDGRFPKTGVAINRQCKEMAHVLTGSGKLFVDDKEYNLKKDDVVLIDKKEHYYWDGKMKLGVPCAPAWWPEQHFDIEFKKVEEKDKDQLFKLIDIVLGGLENKEYFIPYEKWEYDSMFDDKNYAPLYGAYHKGKLVGMAQLYVSQDMLADFKKDFDLVGKNICELGGNLVLPEYRGLGITTALQKIELELAKDLGFDYIISMAHPDNVGSCKTLEKVGLKFVKQTKVANGFLRNLYMIKLK